MMCPYETEEMKTYRRESDIETKVETELMWHKQRKPRVAGGHQRVEETRRDSP